MLSLFNNAGTVDVIVDVVGLYEPASTVGGGGGVDRTCWSGRPGRRRRSQGCQGRLPGPGSRRARKARQGPSGGPAGPPDLKVNRGPS